MSTRKDRPEGPDGPADSTTSTDQAIVDAAIPAVRPMGRFDWEKLLQEGQDLSAGAVAVAFALATWGNSNGTSIHPGVTKLSKAVRKSNRMVIRHLAELRATGWIELTRTSNRRARLADVYRLTAPDHVTPVSPDDAEGEQDQVTYGAGPGDSREQHQTRNHQTITDPPTPPPSAPGYPPRGSDPWDPWAADHDRGPQRWDVEDVREFLAALGQGDQSNVVPLPAAGRYDPWA